MGRENRRYEGGPHYALEEVIRLAEARLVEFTRKALEIEAPRIMPDLFHRREAIRKLVLRLTEERWVFAEEKNGGYVDVYRVAYGERDVWLKLKVELQHRARKIVLVISFHEFDPHRPV